MSIGVLRSNMQKILIIDDDEGVCYSLARQLSSDDRRVTAVQTPEAGFEALRGEDPDLEVEQLVGRYRLEQLPAHGSSVLSRL